jgi:serine protease Do
MTSNSSSRRGGSRLRAALMATTMGVTLALSPLAFAQSPAAQSPAAQPSQTQQVQSQTAVPLQSLSPIVERVMPAVVNISVTMKNGAGGDESAQDESDEPGAPVPGFPQSPFDEFLKRFFDQQGMGGGPNGVPQHRPQTGKRVALGSGFIIDPTGYVVTNNHVVGDAQEVSVVFQDNSKHPAKVVGRDDKTDLALLKIDAPKPLPYVTWGDSDNAKVGDWIMAVGNPFGLGGSVTAGIVSARGRDIHAGPFDDFLQLDAPINRGNSGGPTFSMGGQVIGINTAIYSPSGGSVGIGFAIPSNLAKQVVAQLREHGKVERGWLGVQVQELTPEIAGSLGLAKDDPKGALVAVVQPNSPAAKAGVRQGDVIQGFNGKPVEKLRDLPRLVAEMPAGKQVDLTVWRDKHQEKLQTTIAELSGQDKQMASAGDEQQSAPQGKPEKAGALGLQLAPLDDQVRQRLRLGKEVKGVVVAGVKDQSPAAELGIQPGDVIMSINNKSVATPKHAAAALNEAQASSEKNVLLLLNRRGVTQFVGLSLEKDGNKG